MNVTKHRVNSGAQKGLAVPIKRQRTSSDMEIVLDTSILK
jgi:hypothetical protein